MSEPLIELETLLHPTEDPEKVIRAVRNVVPNCSVERTDAASGFSKMRATARGLESLANLQSMLRRQGIRDAARATLMAGLSGSSITAYLNKQVAYANKISFSDPIGESPLGPIILRITAQDPQALIDWLAPSTRSRT